ncbi:MAG: potassium channel family protein [Planctomycetota bacterium]|nr:potassium channel family protein [Planctomycetota bacterium]
MIVKRLAAFTEFNRVFVRYASYVREVIVSLLVLLVLGGFAISKLEGIKLSDAIYFAFITGLSIGYGDISPQTAWGRVVSVAIGLVGMVFVGLSVAIATRALADTVRRHVKDQN